MKIGMPKKTMGTSEFITDSAFLANPFLKFGIIGIGALALFASGANAASAQATKDAESNQEDILLDLQMLVDGTVNGVKDFIAESTDCSGYMTKQGNSEVVSGAKILEAARRTAGGARYIRHEEGREYAAAVIALRKMCAVAAYRGLFLLNVHDREVGSPMWTTPFGFYYPFEVEMLSQSRLFSEKYVNPAKKREWLRKSNDVAEVVEALRSEINGGKRNCEALLRKKWVSLYSRNVADVDKSTPLVQKVGLCPELLTSPDFSNQLQRVWKLAKELIFQTREQQDLPPLLERVHQCEIIIPASIASDPELNAETQNILNLVEEIETTTQSINSSEGREVDDLRLKRERCTEELVNTLSRSPAGKDALCALAACADAFGVQFPDDI